MKKHRKRKSRMVKGRILADIMLIGCAAAFLTHFILILTNGGILIREPNPWILWVEIVGFAGIAIFGIERLINDL